MAPPNLLFIIADEHRRDALGCYGHPIVKTPHLDALAARGVRFANAYTPSPMCVPARAALAVGDHVHKLGNWDSATPYNGLPRSWMHDVRDRGAETVSIGKLHFQKPDQDHGFTREILPMHVVDGVGWPIALLRDDPPEFAGASELARDAGRGESSYTRYDRSILAAAEDYLAARCDGQPFAAMVSFVSPHYPLTAPDDFYDLYPPGEMDWPIAYDQADRPDHPEINNITRFFDYDRHFTADKIRRAKSAYYGLISFIDHAVGRLIKALEQSGQADNTIIIYTSDHGDMMGDHGIWTKQVMYEASAGIPMIMAGPGLPAGSVTETPVSLIDIAATARAMFDCDAGNYPGADLRAIANEADYLDRVVLSEYHDGGSSTGAFMVRFGRTKYVHYEGLPPQMFDLDGDPDERLPITDPALLAEGERRLRHMLDPAAVNARCFRDQAAKIAALGGREGILAAKVFNHTPAPG